LQVIHFFKLKTGTLKKPVNQKQKYGKSSEDYQNVCTREKKLIIPETQNKSLSATSNLP
jgi:hypothetical protein